MGMVVREKAYAQIVFQEGINTVECTAWSAASYGDVVVPHNDVQVFGAQILDAESDWAGLHHFTKADEHVFVPTCDLVDDRQLHPTGLVEEFLEFLSRVNLTGIGVISYDDVPAVQLCQVYALSGVSVGRTGSAAR